MNMGSSIVWQRESRREGRRRERTRTVRGPVGPNLTVNERLEGKRSGDNSDCSQESLR